MKFSIRDLFLVTAIVALSLGWWFNRQTFVKGREVMQRDIDRAKWEAQTLKVHLEATGAKVEISDEGIRTRADITQKFSIRLFAGRRETPNSSAPAPNWPMP